MKRVLPALAILACAGAVSGASFQINSYFDKGEIDGWKGTLAKGQGYMNRGIGLVPPARNKYCARATGQSNWQRGVIQIKSNTTLTFCYYVTEPASMTLQCWSKLRKDNLKVTFALTPMEWMIHVVPFGKGGMNMALNDSVQQITFLIGKPKQKTLQVLLDNICVGEGVARHMIGAYRKQQKRLSAFTFEINKQHMLFNKGMILSLLKSRKALPSAQKIAVLGDRLAAHAQFADPLLKSPRGFPKARGYSVVGRPDVAADGLTMEKLLAKLPTFLEEEKPEVVLVWIGFEESLARAKTEKKSVEVLAIGQTAEKPKTQVRGKGHRKTYEDGLKKIVEDCLTRGAVPILCTLPLYSRKGGKAPIAPTELLAVNGLVIQTSRNYRVPVIDISGHLESIAKRRGRLVFADGAKAKAYGEINKLIGKMYKAIENQVLRPK